MKLNTPISSQSRPPCNYKETFLYVHCSFSSSIAIEYRLCSLIHASTTPFTSVVVSSLAG